MFLCKFDYVGTFLRLQLEAIRFRLEITEQEQIHVLYRVPTECFYYIAVVKKSIFCLALQGRDAIYHDKSDSPRRFKKRQMRINHFSVCSFNTRSQVLHKMGAKIRSRGV